MFGISELAIVLIVVIAVLAAKRLPELARSAGKSARILKAEARAMKEEEAREKGNGTAADTAPRIIRGETVAPDAGAERPSAPAPERSDRSGGAPSQDGRP
ncbi:Sec-independent protein translocase protein TatA [Streptomyces sp. enrichment culture]|uniref:twin-arginine translocase TatA/TatE family subunit n=1 Tax=Streptomyces sp. enrichment culture TaxID=1795815 RepID=UPI003F579294